MLAPLPSIQPQTSGLWKSQSAPARGRRRPQLNYASLQEIAQLKHLKENNELRDEVLHERFMLTYPSIVQRAQTFGDIKAVSLQEDRSSRKTASRPGSKYPSIPLRLERLAQPKKDRKGEGEKERYATVGDLTYHMSQLHDIRVKVPYEQQLAAAIRDLRAILRILPFERTVEEQMSVANALMLVKPLHQYIPTRYFPRLASIVTLDTYKEDDMTIFGNQGLFLLLKGSVSPRTLPTIHDESDVIDEVFRQPTPLLEDPHEFKLEVGEIFGTLTPLPDRKPNSKVLNMLTRVPGVEVMRISASAYDIMMKKFEAESNTEKLNLLKKCKQYSQWPQLSLNEVASVVDWINVPEGEVLVAENSLPPFVAMIKTGKCNAYRTIEAMHKLSNGTRERRKKKVLIGTLGEADTFGEISLIDQLNMTCTIIAETDLELAVIYPERLHDLNPVTLSLIHQSNKHTFDEVDNARLKEEYVQAESRREWDQFREKIVNRVLYQQQISPGVGKWAKPPAQLQEAKQLAQIKS